MKTLQQYIQEAFDTKPVKWKKINSEEYKFELDDNTYDVDFEISPEHFYQNYNYNIEVSFSIDSKITKGAEKLYSMTGTGNQFKVLVTVMDIINNYVKENAKLFTKEKKSIISFSSEGRGRTNVYRRLINRYIPKNWRVRIELYEGATEFYMGPKEYF